MNFGPMPAAEAEGAVLAHSMTIGDRRLKKGAKLSRADVEHLLAGGVAEVVGARLGPGDVPEDEAAARIAAALAPEARGFTVSAPFTGRANAHAECAGVLEVDAALVHRVNAVHEAVTLATLPAFSRVQPRQMIATAKIIPYAAPEEAVAKAVAILAEGAALRVRPVVRRSASLVLTATPGMKEKLLDKGAEALRDRLAALGVDVADEARVAHETAPLADALGAAQGEMLLILGGSATSDRRDVGPAAVAAAGGAVSRFGMPVDPGNLLFLGRIGARPVIGMPGCARSPALNGVDWVLERVACGLEVTDGDIAAMGVGGLLKEIPSRPQPRGGRIAAPSRPVVSGLLLAAGASSRMRGADKLLEEADGAPLLRRAAEALLRSQLDEVIAVLRPGDEPRRAALDGLKLRIVENPQAAEGMAASIRAGLAALREDADAALVALADMPEMTAAHADRLIAAYDPGEGREIVRAVDAEGQPGHPVLFGRRFFENLARLSGDEGGREILRENAEFVVDAPTPGRGATTDLDTPEDFAAWRGGGQIP